MFHNSLLTVTKKNKKLRYCRQSAMCYLVNWCKTTGTTCTTNPQQLEVTELASYCWPTCSKQPRRINHQAQTSVSFVDNMINLLWWNFPSPVFGTKFQRKVSLFLEIPKLPYNTVWNRWKEASIPKASSIYPIVSIQYRLVTRHTADKWTVTMITANTTIA